MLVLYRPDRMDRQQLRATQAPIKQRYREDGSAALFTLRAEGNLDDQGIACSVATSRGLVEAGLHPGTGGSGTLACSGDMLLEALVACAGVTLRSVATSLEIPVAGVVRAEGDLDFRGTLGVASDDEVPVGFREIRLAFDLTSAASDEQLATLLRLTERYCVVYQTLRAGVPVSVSVSGRPGASAEVRASAELKASAGPGASAELKASAGPGASAELSASRPSG